MDFMTSSTGKKRQMAYIPDVNPNTFLLFFERGSSGYSYSLRDYSVAHWVNERYAHEFRWSAAELRQKARYLFDAPTIETNNLSFWHDYTIKGNEFLRQIGPGPKALSGLPVQAPIPVGGDGQFPIFNSTALHALPKAAKKGDIERMINSLQSEDWVTWNLLNLLVAQCAASWWTCIAAAANQANPSLDLPTGTVNAPKLQFWQVVPAPKAYEVASRERMRTSSDPLLIARSSEPNPVEGNSEIDVVLSGNRFLIYVEAKLGADVDTRTKYDASRNQIVRNIDCLLEKAAGRMPFFWMFVRDTGPARLYVQLMRQYQQQPQTLARDLPHRDPTELRQIAGRLTLVRWRDLDEQLCVARPDDDSVVLTIKKELWRRVS